MEENRTEFSIPWDLGTEMFDKFQIHSSADKLFVCCVVKTFSIFRMGKEKPKFYKNLHWLMYLTVEFDIIIIVGVDMVSVIVGFLLPDYTGGNF
jgi:hypothetical protein